MSRDRGSCLRCRLENCKCKMSGMKIILLLSVSLFLCFAAEESAVSDTLQQGETLNVRQALFSPNHRYNLNFFTSGVAGSDNYLGIFHSTTVVWVANRDTPAFDNSAILTIDKNGTFVISQSFGISVVLYSDGGAGEGVTRTATLQDDGNLVLMDWNADGSINKTLWQSFHHPTDTLLKNMNLGGVEGERGSGFSLSSWLSAKNPSPGAFTLDWDPTEQQMVVRRRGVLVWRSGVLKNGTFEYTRGVTHDCVAVASADGKSLSFASNLDAYKKLTEEGSLVFETDDPLVEETTFNTLDIMGKCYGYNEESGCVKWQQPKCRGDKPTFALQPGFFLRVDTNEIDAGIRYADASVGPGDCRAICWEDCECIAYREADDFGCLFWKEHPQLKLYADYDQRLVYVISKVPVAPPASIAPPPDEDPSQSGNSHSKPGRKLGAWVAMVLFAHLVYNS